MAENICYKCMKRYESSDEKCSICGFVENEYVIREHHLKPGTIIHDRYLIGCVIGEGGFGITYVGNDNVLNVKVAVKEFYMTGCVSRDGSVSMTVEPHYGDTEQLVTTSKAKFLNEAKELAKFDKEKGIVCVRDFFEENNTAYIVMDYIDGMTLKDYVETNGKFDAKELVIKMQQLMKSLEVVHSNNIIHRDISPENIMVDDKLELKLLDFGAAREVLPDVSKSLSVILKPGYAPEEQYRKKGKQGPWTDVYSLCGTIYYCVTGKVPEDSMERFFDDTLQDLCEIEGNCPQKVSDVIKKGMAIEAKDRYQNIGELCDALNDAIYDSKEDVFVCPVCKSTISSSWQFCKYCGQAIELENSDNEKGAASNELKEFEKSKVVETEKTKRRKKNVSIGISIVLGLVVVLGVFVLNRLRSEESLISSELEGAQGYDNTSYISDEIEEMEDEIKDEDEKIPDVFGNSDDEEDLNDEIEKIDNGSYEQEVDESLCEIYDCFSGGVTYPFGGKWDYRVGYREGFYYYVYEGKIYKTDGTSNGEFVCDRPDGYREGNYIYKLIESDDGFKISAYSLDGKLIAKEYVGAQFTKGYDYYTDIIGIGNGSIFIHVDRASKVNTFFDSSDFGDFTGLEHALYVVNTVDQEAFCTKIIDDDVNKPVGPGMSVTIYNSNAYYYIDDGGHEFDGGHAPEGTFAKSDLNGENYSVISKDLYPFDVNDPYEKWENQLMIIAAGVVCGSYIEQEAFRYNEYVGFRYDYTEDAWNYGISEEYIPWINKKMSCNEDNNGKILVFNTKTEKEMYIDQCKEVLGGINDELAYIDLDGNFKLFDLQ